MNGLSDGLGADVAIEAVGIPETFELCTDLVRPGGCGRPARSRRPAPRVTARHRRAVTRSTAVATARGLR